jgi:hypothetical protein
MKVVLAIAALGLSVAGANACDYMKSAKVDTTIVASVTPAEAAPMSTAQDALPPLVEETTTSDETKTQ